MYTVHDIEVAQSMNRKMPYLFASKVELDHILDYVSR